MKKQIWLMVLVLAIVGLACGSSADETPDIDIDTFGESLERKTGNPTHEIPPYEIPTEVPEIEGLVKTGTHLVGTDIQPGIYVGLAGDDLWSSCYWERLSGLTGSFDELIANDNAEGLFYIEVLATDIALKVDCELLPIFQVPARSEFLTVVPIGTYIVGRDIQPGLYKGEAGDDILGSCYWERLSGVSGGFGNILANDNAEGQYFIEVLPSDFALHVSCEVRMVQ